MVTARTRFTGPVRTSLSMLALVLAPAWSAAGPRDEALRLIPKDVTFSLLVQDLRGFTKPAQDELGDHFLAVPLGKGMPFPPEVQEVLKKVDEALRELNLGATPKEMLNEIFGDVVVYAFRKDGMKPEKEAGMLVLWARDPKLLARVVDRVNAWEIERGHLLEVREVTGDGRKYQQRVRKPDEGDEFYALRGNVFCISNSEQLIREAVGLADTAPPADKEAPPLAESLKQLAVETAFLSWWVNPRSFDAEIDEAERTAKGAPKAFLTRFREYWKSADGAAFFMSPDPKRVDVGVSFRVRKGSLPAPAQTFLTEGARPSALWQVIPEDALLALAARLEAPALIQAFAGFLGPEGREPLVAALEMALRALSFASSDLPVLGKGVGPDWGFWVVAPSAAENGWFPQFMLAVKTRKGDDGEGALAALVDALKAFANFATIGSGGQIGQEKERDGKVEIRYLTGRKFPAGLRPAFAAKDGYLLVAGSPHTIRGFKPPADEPKASDETPLLRVSLKGWHGYLTAHRKAVIDYLSATQGISADAAGKQVDTAIEACQGEGRLEVVVRSQVEHQAALVLRVRPAKK